MGVMKGGESTLDVFRKLKEYYWPFRNYFYASMVLLVCSTALGLVYPYMLKFLIDDLINPGRFDLVPYLAVALVFIVSIKACAGFAWNYIGHLFGIEMVYDLRNGLYRKLQYVSFQYYDNAKTGDLMSRLTADVEAFRQFLSFGIHHLVNFFLMIGFGMVMMLSINWKLTLVTLVTMPFLGAVALRFERLIHPAFVQIRESMSDLTTAVQENITGVRTVKSFARETHEIDKFNKRSDGYKNTHIMTANLWAKYFPVMELLGNLSVVLLLGYGGYLVIQNQLTIGELVAFFSLIWYIIGPIWSIGYQINNYTQSKAAGERLLEILEAPHHVDNRPGAVNLTDVQGHVTFNQVSFAYNNKEEALHDIQIDAPPGKIIALLGATGSGKSSVIQLLLRSYDVTSGSVKVDGVDVRDIKLESLRKHIGVVFQETFLFSASIRNNIAYGKRDTTIEDIIAAAKLAQAHDFIMELPQGYDTIVGERGMGLSGGQKQRIAIARALLVNPRILVLDDATSAVDMETEFEIQAALRNVMQGRTTFIIAHRLSSLKHADEIVVLEDGHIVQRGKHDELVGQQGIYRRIYDIQFSDQEASGKNPAAERRIAQ
jgi:ATP-binding cassette subfamily B multidrug efflux pump